MDRKTTRSPRTRPMRTASWLLTASLVALGAGTDRPGPHGRTRAKVAGIGRAAPPRRHPK